MRVVLLAVFVLTLGLAGPARAEVIWETLDKGTNIWVGSALNIQQQFCLGNGLEGKLETVDLWARTSFRSGKPAVRVQRSLSSTCGPNDASSNFYPSQTEIGTSPTGHAVHVDMSAANWVFEPQYYYSLQMDRSSADRIEAFGVPTPDICIDNVGAGQCNGTPYLIINADVNSPPTVSDLGQFKQSGADAIAEGETFIGNSAVFRGTVVDDSGEARFEVEVKPAGTAFDTIGTYVTNLTATGEISIPVDELIPPPQQTPEEGYQNAFHWRARAIDEQEEASEWQEFGIIGITDFIAHYTLGQAASDLAKQVVEAAYLLAAKGWDVVSKNYVPSNVIRGGYHATSSASIGSGLDCSGLIVWAYNKLVDESKSFADNFMTDLIANDQFNARQVITEEELQPGDQLFFDWDSNGRVDHVVMYVGGDPERNLIHAQDELNGITTAKLSVYKTLPGFAGFGRPQNSPLALAVTAHSPVHLSVTDPDGTVIDHTTVIASETEYIREAGDLRYVTLGVDANGHPEDMVYSKVLKSGDYKISVTPIPDVTLDQTYSLEFTAGDETVTLATDVPLAEIPQNGYQVSVSPDEDIKIVKTLNASADTYVKAGTPNKNQGTEGILRVRAAGDNRALVMFDFAEVPQNAVVSSAKLVLNIAYNKDNWGSDGRTIGVHTMIKDWTELGATWNCGIDSNTSNSNASDCNGTNWEMGKPLQPQLWPYEASPQATTTIANGQLGEIEFDVTDDVQEFLAGSSTNFGWLIRKQKEGATGHVEFSSKETENGPKLIVTYQ